MDAIFTSGIGYRTDMNRKAVLSAIGSGLLLTLAFPRADGYGLAWLALVPLLLSFRKATAARGFSLGLIAGLSHYLTLLYWLVGTMTLYGQLPAVVSVSLLVLLCFYLALYWAGFAYLCCRFWPRPTAGFLFFIPALWTALEWIRTYLLSGFPWGCLGYSQYQVLPLIQLADLTGVYGVSFLIVMANAALFLLVMYWFRRDWQGNAVARKTAVFTGVAFLSAAVAAWTYGNHRIGFLEARMAGAAQKTISVIQGNIDQSVKWDPAFQAATVRKYLSLSRRAAAEKPDLIVWPETATPFYFLAPHATKLTWLVQNGIRDIGTYFLIGSPSFIREIGRLEYYNSAYLMDPAGRPLQKYDKVHLVPYGEYVPLKKWFPFLGKLVAQVGDFRGGKKGATLHWSGNRLGVQICFEIIFPELSRSMADNQADLLINITNDAWFGKTGAPYQHLSMALFRAVENRRSLARAANTGISGFIDPIGRITAATALFEDAALTRPMPLIRDKTVYSRFGDVFAAGCLAIVLLFLVWRYTKKGQTP
ncbi:MAG: apolipoprotein N-acyltransferase [Thermodesulfobacteriota bacterium]